MSQSSKPMGGAMRLFLRDTASPMETDGEPESHRQD